MLRPDYRRGGAKAVVAPISLQQEDFRMTDQTIEQLPDITEEQVDQFIAAVRRGDGHEGKHHPHLVTVTVDGQPKQVRQGRYRVSLFKKAVGVDPTYELDELVNGKLVTLADDGHIKVKGGESFVSHVRGGSSS
jgi:hypothetical protein